MNLEMYADPDLWEESIVRSLGFYDLAFCIGSYWL